MSPKAETESGGRGRSRGRARRATGGPHRVRRPSPVCNVIVLQGCESGFRHLISACICQGMPHNRAPVRPKAGRRPDFEGFPSRSRPKSGSGNPSYSPEALLRDIEYSLSLGCVVLIPVQEGKCPSATPAPIPCPTPAPNPRARLGTRFMIQYITIYYNIL